jgi:hypothetical protein
MNKNAEKRKESWMAEYVVVAAWFAVCCVHVLDVEERKFVT